MLWQGLHEQATIPVNVLTPKPEEQTDHTYSSRG